MVATSHEGSRSYSVDDLAKLEAKKRRKPAKKASTKKPAPKKAPKAKGRKPAKKRKSR